MKTTSIGIPLGLIGTMLLFAASCSRQVEQIIAPAESLAQVALLQASAGDWPWWRGPTFDAKAATAAPIHWSDTENIVWKADVFGRGHSSPSVCGSRVFVTTADDAEETQWLLALDRETGSELWRREIHRGGFMRQHSKNSHASGSPVCDGERVFTTFMVQDGVWLTATDLEGEPIWQKKVGDFRSRHGFGSTSVPYKSTIIAVGDHSGGSYITALDRTTGDVVWQTPRGTDHSFGSPVVAYVAGRDQLLLAGQNEVISYDPNSGEIIWRCRGPADTTANTIAWSGDLVFAGGGWPQTGVQCIRADGSGDVSDTHLVWSNRSKLYVPSPLVVGDRLIAIRDDGIAMCFHIDTGKELWKKRLGGGFSASPTLAGGLVYVPNEAGKMFIFEPGEKYKQIATIDLADGGFASPVICQGQIFLRTEHHLYCIGEPDVN